MNSARIKNIAAVSVLTVLCPSAFALDPSLDINQYAHKAWAVREGFFKGAIYAIAQTPDGYLWIGTEFSLERFDGVRSIEWQPPNQERLPGGAVRSLLAARDGRLWIGTEKGLASWRDGKLTHYPELDGQAVMSLLEAQDGTMWAAGTGNTEGPLCAIRARAVQCYGQDGSLGRTLLSLYEDRRGNLWVGTLNGVWRWGPGAVKFFPTPGLVVDLAEGDDGELLISTTGGMGKLVNGRIKPYPLRGVTQRFSRLLRDREAGKWIGTLDGGLLHLHQGRIDRFAHSDGLSGEGVLILFEDREGSIWTGGSDGLDRFREFAIPTITAKQGLSSAAVIAVLAAKDGSIWLGTENGLDRWNDGEITIYGKGDGLPPGSVLSLFQDRAGRVWISTNRQLAYFEDGKFTTVPGIPGGFPMVGDGNGNVWMSRTQESLFHFRPGTGVEQIRWSKLGHKDFALSMLPDPAQAGLWLGFSQGGVTYFNDGQIHSSYGPADGLGEGSVWGLKRDEDGTIWAATLGGLSRKKNGQVLTLSNRNGLPCNVVKWVMEDNGHFFWVYTACGLLRIARRDLDAWAVDPRKTVPAVVFDSTDGVRIISGITATGPAKSADGKIWFLPGDGVSVIDPRHLPFNKIPPPVHIEQIIADDKPYDLRPGMRLPANVRNLRIDYTALSLVAPEKIHFKYKLEGQNQNWHEVINERQATYTNLAPRKYRFRVIASNNSGVWNETGDSLEFSVAPAYYQTNWFRASLVAAFFLALWALYRMRLRQIAQEFNARLEGRVEERTRVARDLHDTLLQSFQGLIPVFQTARNLLPGRADRAAEVLDEGLHDAADAIVEGRNAIQNLRAIPSLDPDLGSLLNAAGQELAQSAEAEVSAPAFRVVVEGPRVPLAPLLRDEIYRIGREVLRNAFRHAHANRIEAEIRYDTAMFRLRIRDDGKGIDPSVLKEGARTGHFGLPGMHERAKRMGGRLKVWSEPGAGTEAELTVPARIAYEKFSTSNGWWARLGRRLRLTAPDREAS